MAALDCADLVRAALACATLLDQTATSAARTAGGEVPNALARFVRRHLEEAAGQSH